MLSIKNALNCLQNTRGRLLACASRTFNPRIPISRTLVTKLREYQEDCIQSVLRSLNNGSRRLGISLATGAGKTVIFTQLIGRVQPPPHGAFQTLIIVHRRELAEQAAAHCRNAYPDLKVEVDMGNIHATGLADITVASIWSLISAERLSKYDPSRYKLILVDEAHHVVSKSFVRALEHFKLLKSNLNELSPVLLGFSATLSRFDGLRLSDALDEIVYHKDYVDMIEEKWLSNVIFTTVRSRADLSKVNDTSSGDFQTGQLSRAVNTPAINVLTVETWMQRASRRTATLIFCVDIAHVVGLTSCFRQHGLDARYISGKTPKVLRSAALDEFKSGKFPILLNCGIFTEGTDIPNIDCVLLARPTKSRNLLVQMIGRGMRLHPGKANCHVIDMVASLQSGITTTPSLFGLDPASLVEEASVTDLKNAATERDESGTQLISVADDSSAGVKIADGARFIDYDSVYDLIDDTKGERFIRSISRLAWVKVADSRYILANSDGSYISIDATESADDVPYEVNFYRRMTPSQMIASNTKVPLMRGRLIARSLDLSEAVRAADTFATSKLAWKFIYLQQRWRQSNASDTQVAFLNKLRPQDQQIKVGDISKGKANDMITKIKFGAKGKFSKIDLEKRKRQKTAEKLRIAGQQRERESVRVGPISSGAQAE